MTNIPDPEAMRRPADVKEKPAELLARMGKRYGPEFVALCRMLATMSERDWARAFNLFAATARERLATVEMDIIRHTFHARPDKGEQLGQFRVLYARLIDIATAAHHAVTAMSGDGPAERVNLFVDLFSAVCAMIGHPEVSPDVPAELQRSGVSGIWPASQPGRPVDKGKPIAQWTGKGGDTITAYIPDEAPDKVDRDNPENTAPENLPEGSPRSDKSASPYAGGFPPGTPLT